MSKPVCVVLGVGPGLGGAFARRFHAEGHAVALLARSKDTSASLAAELPGSKAYACDASDPASIEAAFGAIAKEMGPVATLIYNAGSGTWGSVETITAKDFEASWRVNALGALVASQQVIGPMKAAGKGNIVFVGATASRRGNVRTAAFAPAKAAQRSLAESMARTLWPAGIHVSLVIVDGAVDLPRTREMMKDKPDDFFIAPSAVAEIALRLTEQKPSAWSFEVEARPHKESW